MTYHEINPIVVKPLSVDSRVRATHEMSKKATTDNISRLMDVLEHHSDSTELSKLLIDVLESTESTVELRRRLIDASRKGRTLTTLQAANSSDEEESTEKLKRDSTPRRSSGRGDTLKASQHSSSGSLGRRDRDRSPHRSIRKSSSAASVTSLSSSRHSYSRRARKKSENDIRTQNMRVARRMSDRNIRTQSSSSLNTSTSSLRSSAGGQNVSWSICPISGATATAESRKLPQLHNGSKSKPNLFGNVLVTEENGEASMPPPLNPATDTTYLQFEMSAGQKVAGRKETDGLTDLLDDLRRSKHSGDEDAHGEQVNSSADNKKTGVRMFLKHRLSKGSEDVSHSLSMVKRFFDHKDDNKDDHNYSGATDLHESMASLGSFASVGSHQTPYSRM